ncbi:DUF1439 domain-containing protein [Alteromonas sp. CYL-A6]|uniref:DUF1439 domain-containing protein n=1 Tax=Alteromonas nitratireducens TaxID=3390813 RepID=UPI0034C2933B
MQHLKWRDKWQFALAWTLVKLGRLTHDDFTEDELNALIAPHFPQRFPLNIPVGNGTVEVMRGSVKCHEASNRLCLQALASLNVQALGAQIYRAHLMIAVSCQPRYQRDTAQLHLENMTIDSLRLINDDYGLIKDTTFLIKKFVPGFSLGSMVGQSLLGALSMMSGGISQQTLDYLLLYMDGSMQRVLDYHRPQIERALLDTLNEFDLHHQMREEHWREYLFSLLGQRVGIEDSRLRFYF